MLLTGIRPSNRHHFLLVGQKTVIIPAHKERSFSFFFFFSLFWEFGGIILSKFNTSDLLCCRYAFKLTYDEAVLGEVTSEDELVEYMTEYDRDWYLGTEADRNWQLSILDEKPCLFSLGRDKSKVRNYFRQQFRLFDNT